MDKEIVEEVINQVSFGNDNLRRVMRLVCCEAADLVASWPDSDVEKFRNRLVWASGCLVRKKLSYGEMSVFKERFWNTKKGISVNNRLGGFVQARGLK